MTLSFCCWQSVLTEHQAHTLAELAKASGGELIAVSSRSDNPIRQQQGWVTDTGEVAHEILPEANWLRRIRALLRDPARIHIFAGPFERSRVTWALVRALLLRRKIVLIAEPYSSVPVAYLTDSSRIFARAKVIIRPFVYRIYGILLRRRVLGVFAISPPAVEQFARLGFDRRRIFPFGYFVPRQSDPQVPDPREDGLRVAYVGSFIARKGVQSLLDAFSTPAVMASGATLTLFGPGSVAHLQLGEGRTRYLGPLPFGAVQARLADFDLAVVPSLFDGWAVIVNEAILAGVPVLASSGVGAGAMVRHWQCGAVFDAGAVDDLAGIIAAYAADRTLVARSRTAAGAAAPLILPAVAGQYMAQCIAAALADREPPAQPWY